MNYEDGEKDSNKMKDYADMEKVVSVSHCFFG